MYKRYLISCILVIRGFQLYQLQAQEKSEKCEFAVHLGVGSLFGGTGIMAEYQFPFSKRVKFTPFLSFGSQAPFTEIPGMWWGYTSGVNLEFGRVFFNQGTALNWLVGFNYGSQGVGSDNISVYNSDPSNLYINKHLLTGFALIAGYKITNRSGFTFQVNIGMCHVQNPIGNNKHYFLKPTGGFGIGYKHHDNR